MALLASDSKEFKRPRLERDGDGTVTVVDSRGFFTQLGVAILVPDPERFRTELIDGFKEAAKAHHIELPRMFGSSEFVVNTLFARRYMEARSFLHKVVERVQDKISHVDVTWLIASPHDTPTIEVGGSEAAHREIPIREFIVNAGNSFSMVSAWTHTKIYPGAASELHVDLFQGKPSLAWTQLSSLKSTLRIVPRGDECDPFICAADILAYLTDRGLHAGRLKLFPDNVRTVWKERPFRLRAGYLDPQVFPEIAPLDDHPVRLNPWFLAPMTYLMVDRGLLSETPSPPPPAGVVGADDEPKVSYRGFLETSGFIHAAYLSSQFDNGGFKVFDAPTDSAHIRDGDRLVWMGKQSKDRAEAIQSAVDVKVESMRELRERVRAKGFRC